MSEMSRAKNKSGAKWKTMALGTLVIMIAFNLWAKESYADPTASVITGQSSTLGIVEMAIIVVIAIGSLVLISEKFNSMYKN